MTRKAKRKSLGSTGCQPVVFGSLPKIIQREAFNKGVIVTHNFAGKLPATAGWQPALPRTEHSPLFRHS
jgi:hypothetical protein